MAVFSQNIPCTAKRQENQTDNIPLLIVIAAASAETEGAFPALGHLRLHHT
jgi:hypothetical protein